MALTTTSRFALQQWGASSDGPTRAQFNASFLNIENRAAAAWQGLKAHLAGLDGGLEHRDRQLVFAQDTSELFWDDGANFIPLPTFQTVGTFSARQTINAPVGPQLWLQNGAGNNTIDTHLRLRRATTTDGAQYKQSSFYLTANVAFWQALAYNDSGINSDISGLSGRWAVNWGSDTIPTDTFIIKTRGGVEIARFAETGFVGIGQNNPTSALEVKNGSGGTLARFGFAGNTNSMTLVPGDEHTMTMMFGGDYAGGYVARSTSVAMINASPGALVYYANAGLTIGAAFTPTIRWSVDVNGSERVRETLVGLGARDGTSIVGRLGDAGSSDTIYLLTSKASGLTNIALQPLGAGSALLVQPEGTTGASFYKSAATANMISANLGFSIFGASTASFAWPAARLIRVGGTINGSGIGSAAHGITSFNPGNVAVATASCKGNSGESFPVPITAIDGVNVGVSGGISGRAWRASFWYSEGNADW